MIACEVTVSAAEQSSQKQLGFPSSRMTLKIYVWQTGEPCVAVAECLLTGDGPQAQMALLQLVSDGMKLRCRAVAEIEPCSSPLLLCMQLKEQEQHNGDTRRFSRGKGKGSLQLPSAQPPSLEEARIISLHPQRKKTLSFQSL